MPELIFQPDLGKKAYRLKCRFITVADPRPEWVEAEKYRQAERFTEDMSKRGFIYDPNKLPASERGFKLSGPYPATSITGLPPASDYHQPTGREARDRVLAGDLMRSSDKTYVADVPNLDSTDKWEWELSAVFIHPTIRTELE